MLRRWAQRVAALIGLGAVDGTPETPGGTGEAAAARYLERMGFKVLGRNIKCRLGEIDILAMDPDGRTVVVVEVKTRQDGPGTPVRYDATRPEERVGRAKQRKLTALASWAVRRYRLEKHPVRFDVIGVDLKGDGKHDVRHYPGAFESHV